MSRPFASAAPRTAAFSAPVLCALIFAAVFAAYWPALRGEFLWDDTSHVTRPDLRSLGGLGRIWFEIGATQQYYPLLHSAFWLEHRLWGDSPSGYHIVNLLLHATAACLFGGVLRRLSVPGAWLAASLFALHPVCVESVAWISEQKNTLSAVLYLAAAMAYLKWHGRSERNCASVVARASRPWTDADPNTGETPVPHPGLLPSPGSAPATARERSRLRPHLWYAFATLFFVGALLTKTVTATLPAALLVLAWWQRGRIDARRDVLPLLPWFALGAASGLVTAWFERTLIGASGAEFALAATERLLLAGRVVWFYLGKLFWPSNLTFIYPRWEIDAVIWWQWLFPVAALALLFALWRFARSGSQAHVTPPAHHVAGVVDSGTGLTEAGDSRTASHLSARVRRTPLAVALLFGGTLFPVLGFFNVFPFLYSFVADHFQYLASLAIFAAAGAALARASGRISTAATGYSEAGPTPADVAQKSSRPNTRSRRRRELPAAPPTPAESRPGRRQFVRHLVPFVLLVVLGTLTWRQSHMYRDIFALFEATIARNPGAWMAYNNLGIAHAEAGRFHESIALYEQAFALNPRNASAQNNLGYALLALERHSDALPHFQRALELQPALTPVHNNLGRALMELGRHEEGLAAFAEALRLDPHYGDAHYNLGLALARLGETGQAIAHFERAAELNPNDSATQLNWAVGLTLTDHFAEAEPRFLRAIALNPNSPNAHFAYGRALAENGRPNDALPHLRAAVELRPEFALAREQLVEVLRRLGRTDEARAHEAQLPTR